MKKRDLPKASENALIVALVQISTLKQSQFLTTGKIKASSEQLVNIVDEMVKRGMLTEQDKEIILL